MIENYKGHELLHYEFSFLKGGLAQLIAFKCINQTLKLQKYPSFLAYMYSDCQDHRSWLKAFNGFSLEKVGLYLLYILCYFYRRRLLNESQTHDMYCLWFIPIIVLAAILMMYLHKSCNFFCPHSQEDELNWLSGVLEDVLCTVLNRYFLF